MPTRVSSKLLVLIMLLLAAACAAPPFDAPAVAREWAMYMQRDYTLRPGDRLEVRVDQLGDGTRDPLQEVLVSPTGSIDLVSLPAPLQVSGKTISAARTLILEAYKHRFAEPRVNVRLAEASAQSVYVCGEVADAGALAYVPGMTMTQAIAAAGSFEYTIKHSDVRILRINPDGTQRTFRVNMEAVLLDEQPDFLLLPGDVVYCQTSTIADLGNMVDLYIRRLLPFSITGVSVGSGGGN
ncbi:MAG: polysaccharide export protein [Planctomycetes bacterium]|nr:polysaccharide export protein [Planctomycetota bacterium]